MTAETLGSLLRVVGVLCAMGAVLAAVRWWQLSRARLQRRVGERIAAALLDIDTGPPVMVSPASTPGEYRSKALALPFLRRYLAEAGLPADGRTVLLIAAIWTAAAGALALALFDSTILRILTLILGLAAPALLILKRHERVEQELERQLPEGIDVMVRALQAGKPLAGCWEEMASVLGKPMAPLCHEIHLKLQYGGELDDVLTEVSARVPSEDVRFFFTALRIQRRSGGNLVALLRDQSQLIRDRLALRGHIRALSSESRLSAWVMGLMPFFTVLMMLGLSPRTMSLLWSTPAGISMIEFGLVMQLIGVLWIARLVRIRM
jgi:tight adherence protein B